MSHDLARILQDLILLAIVVLALWGARRAAAQRHQQRMEELEQLAIALDLSRANTEIARDAVEVVSGIVARMKETR